MENNLKEYREKLAKLSEEEKKLRDLYLHDLSSGKIQGPATEYQYPSIVKPWLKYYSREDILINDDLSKSISQNLSESCTKNCQKTGMRYIGQNILCSTIKEKSNQIAKSLIAMGVKKGDIITVCLPCVPEFGYFFRAINSIGAVSNWLDFRTGTKELEQTLKSVNSSIVITFDGVCDKVNDAIKTCNINENKIKSVIKVSPTDSLPQPISTLLNAKKFLSRFAKGSDAISNLEIDYKTFLNYGKTISDDELEQKEKNTFKKDDTAVIVYTGGTTGFPKGVELTNENFNAVLDGYKRADIGLSEGDSFLHFLPPWTAYGLVIYYIIICLGIECILIPKLDPATYDKLILKEKPNHTTGIPKNLDILRNSKYIKNTDDLSFFKTAGVGADIMNPIEEQKTLEFLKKHNSNGIVSKGYGMTEGCAAVTLSTKSANKLGSTGIPFVRNNVSIFDPETREEKHIGELGEICYTGDSVMKSYYQNVEATNEVLVQHEDGKIWMHSGDLGYIDEDGFLFIVDRIKRMFVRSGFKLFSSVIASTICQQKNVKYCAAVGVKDEFEGALPVAFIVLDNNYGEDEKSKILSEINEICSKELFEYYMPLNYVITDSIPYTKNGKVDYRELTTIATEKLKSNNVIRLLKK